MPKLSGIKRSLMICNKLDCERSGKYIFFVVENERHLDFSLYIFYMVRTRLTDNFRGNLR